MNIRNVKIRFNLDRENDRRAFNYLQNAEQSYSKAVISALCGYMDLSEAKANEDAFLERVIRTIREETSKANPLGGLLQLAQSLPAQAIEQKENTDENDAAALEFLASF